MQLWAAQFIETDEINSSPIGGSFGLDAENLDDAREAALGLPRPRGANAVQILRRGWVEETQGLLLD